MSIIEEIPYTPEPILNTKKQVVGLIERPYLKVRIKYNHKLTITPVTCLVDSGSDYNLFPAAWGDAISIPIEKGELRMQMGIGGYQLRAFKHNIHMYIINTKVEFDTFAYFSKDVTVPLLGRRGFFDKLKSIEFSNENSSLKLHI